jgi:hypothetical protein
MSSSRTCTHTVPPAPVPIPISWLRLSACYRIPSTKLSALDSPDADAPLPAARLVLLDMIKMSHLTELNALWLTVFEFVPRGDSSQLFSPSFLSQSSAIYSRYNHPTSDHYDNIFIKAKVTLSKKLYEST